MCAISSLMLGWIIGSVWSVREGQPRVNAVDADASQIDAALAMLAATKGDPEEGYSATVTAMSGQLEHRPDAATCEVLI